MQANKSFILPVIFTALLFSCHPLSEIKPAEELRYEQKEATIASLKEILRNHDLKALKSPVTLNIIRKDGSGGEFQGLIVFQQPDRFNMRVFGPIGLTVLEVIIVSGNIQIYIPLKNELYTGEIPAGLSLFSLIDNPDSEYFMDETEEEYILSMFRLKDDTSLDAKAKFYFIKSPLRNRKIEFFREAAPFIGIGFDSFLPLTSNGVPSLVTISLQDGTVANIKIDSPKVNIDIPDSYFTLHSAHGKDVKPLQGLSNSFLK